MTDDVQNRGIMSKIFTWRNLRILILFGLLCALILFFVVWLWFQGLARSDGMPDIDDLAKYEPPITSRVHGGDGALIAEFADQHRVFVPYDSIPIHVVQAFVSAEDKNFFKHNGLDYVGIARAAKNNITTGSRQGGSTITQQVAKNMLLTRDQTYKRKAKEAIVAQKMEKEFSKEHIIELYLNEIYLGGSSYGVGSAALNYFNKSLPELTLSEAAILASLAKAPSAVNPYTKPDKLLSRRNYVLGRMVEDGYITQEQADDAKATPLNTVKRLRGPEYAAATYFVQELRRDLIEQYDEELLEQGGLSIRSTIDTKMQLAAQEALQNGLEAYDRRHGYRGPLINISGSSDMVAALNEVSLPGGYGTWEAGYISSFTKSGAKITLTDGAETVIPAEDLEWAKSYEANGENGLIKGDVVLVEVTRQVLNANETSAPPAEDQLDHDGNLAAMPKPEPILVPKGQATLRQVPEVDGGLIALDPHTGRVLAMAGGYSFFKNAFNRVTQSQRQPGSSFKPFVYAAALEKGYTPATQQLDAPFVSFDVEKDEYWAPKNYSEGRSYGMVTLRVALEKSLNQVTARVAKDIGMEAVSDLSERMGVYTELPPYDAMSLGAGEASLLSLAKGYAAFVNGGREVTPTFLDRVQDRYGRTLYKHDERECSDCQQAEWNGQRPPALPDGREQVLDPITAYQVTNMLAGVVERGTGRRALKVGKPLAGKTGTTDDYRDAIFAGFSPDLVVAVRVGFDDNRSLGEGEAGGSVAAPIFTEFMQEVLADQAALPFRIPPGVRLVEVDARTGELPGPTTAVTIQEAFRPGSEPGLEVFNDTETCLSISGACDGQGGTGILGILDETPVPEDVSDTEPQLDEDGNVVEDDMVADVPEDDLAGDDLSGTF